MGCFGWMSYICGEIPNSKSMNTFILDFLGLRHRQQFKNGFALFLSSLIAICADAIEVDNKNTFVVGKFIYMIGAESGVNDAEAWLVGVKPGVMLEGEITIPGSATINDTRYTVTMIGSAFESGYPEMWWYNYEPAIANHPGISKVTIPSTIRKIEVYEFLGCSGIAEFHVNSANKYFKDDNGILFRRYNSDTESQEWSLFRMPPATKKTKYTIPAGTRQILDNAFADNKSIKSLILGGNLQFSRFWSNRNLGISSIDVSAASHYDSLAGLIYYSDEWSINGETLGKYGALVTCPPALAMDKLTLPQSVKVMNAGAFANTSISEIVFPSGLKEIGKYTFYASKLKTLKLSVDNIAYQEDFDGLCLDCGMLETVELNGSSSKELLIDDNMFRGCSSLKDLAIGSDKVKLGSCAFYGCKSLTSFPFAKVTSWETGYYNENDGFQFAYSGLTSARVPSGFSIVPRGMFMGSDLASVNLNPSQKNTLKGIMPDAFRDCKLSEVHLESVTELGKSCFAGTPLKRVIFPCKSEEDEYSGGCIKVDESFTPAEDTWFYVGNNRIEWDVESYNWNSGQYASGLEKAVYVSAARHCNNVPNKFKAVYGPAGCTSEAIGSDIYATRTATDGGGKIFEIFGYKPINGATAFEIKQSTESSDLSFKVNSVIINEQEASCNRDVWSIPGTVNPLAYEHSLHYTVNGVEMISFYPADEHILTSVEKLNPESDEAHISAIFDINGRCVGADRDSLAPGVYIIHYSNGTTIKIIK